MTKDASAIFQSQVREASQLERLSAVETLKGLKSPDKVSLRDLVAYLDSRGLWAQFAKITLGDLRDAFAPAPAATNGTKRRKKPRILEEELEDAYAEADAEKKAPKPKAVEDGGMATEEFARLVMPFVEGNGEVTMEDVKEYSRLDPKVIRHHLGVLVKEGRLERIGVGRHAVYTSL